MILAKSAISIYLSLLLGISYSSLQEIIVLYKNKPVTDKAIKILGKSEKQLLKICGKPKEVISAEDMAKAKAMFPFLVDKNVKFYSFPRVDAYIRNGFCVFSRAKKVQLGKYEDKYYISGGSRGWK